MGLFNKNILKEALKNTLIFIIIFCVFGALLFALVKAILIGSVFLIVVGFVIVVFLIAYGTLWFMHPNEK